MRRIVDLVEMPDVGLIRAELRRPFEQKSGMKFLLNGRGKSPYAISARVSILIPESYFPNCYWLEIQATRNEGNHDYAGIINSVLRTGWVSRTLKYESNEMHLLGLDAENSKLLQSAGIESYKSLYCLSVADLLRILIREADYELPRDRAVAKIIGRLSRLQDRLVSIGLDPLIESFNAVHIASVVRSILK